LVGSPEIAAYQSGAISKKELQQLAFQQKESEYGKAINAFVAR